MYEASLVFVLFLVYFYITIKKKHNFWKNKNIKHIKPVFLLGTVDFLTEKSLTERSLEFYNQFPDERYFGLYQGTEPILVFKDLDLIRFISIKALDHFNSHRDFLPEDVDPFWMSNLFTSKNDRWRQLRRILTPSFTSYKFKTMFGQIEECAKNFVQFFDQQNQDIISFEAKDTFSRYTNDVAAIVTFGKKCDSLSAPQNIFYQMGKEGTNFAGFKIFKIFLYLLIPSIKWILQVRVITQSVANFFSLVIRETIDKRLKENIFRQDILHLLLKAQINNKQTNLTMNDIVSQIFIFYIANFETVSTFISFAFYELALNPKIQQRLREEMQDAGDTITYHKIQEMKYLEMVTCEFLRKWPPSLLSDRKVTKSFIIPPANACEIPVELPKDLTCWIPIYALHRDPKYFPNPEKFDPERFNNVNKHTIPKAYMPFGVGPRACIGARLARMETKILIYHVLKKFEIVITDKTLVPVILDSKKISTAVKGGMWLGLKKL